MSDEPANQSPDVTRLMEAIQRLIRESGGALHTDKEEEAAVTGRLASLMLESGMRLDMLDEMRGHEGDEGNWNLTEPYPLRSHRGGPAGRAIDVIKLLLRRLGVLLGNPLVYRQAEINAYLRTVINHLLREQVRTERKVAHLERILLAQGAPDEEQLRSDVLDRIQRLVAEPEEE